MLFSVVIPLYNKSYSIKRCISSVLAQNYKKYEIIVVNDGSNDDSLTIIEDNYVDQIQKGLIKVINQPNQGVSVARNNGIRASKSEYICLLDADDEWKPNFLRKMTDLVNDYPYADLYSLAHMVQKEGAGLRKPKLGLPVSHRGYVEDFFKASSNGEVANSSKVCVRKQALLSFGGFPEGIVAGEDLYVWIRLALKGQVACDISYSVIVNQENDSSRGARKISVPYPFTYFSKNQDILRSKSLNKYLFVIFYKHFMRSLLSFQFKEAFMRLKVYISIFI